MRVLAIDTALGACSAALVEHGVSIAAISESMERGHAERLAPLVDELMRGAGAAFADIDRIAVTVGPGSFTGVRVGLSFARGLALALDKPCVGVSTLEALAGEGEGEGEGVRGGAIPAAGEVYLAFYRDGAVVLSPGRFPLDIAAAHVPDGALLRGPGAALLARPGVAIEPIAHADPVVLARLATARDPAMHPSAPQYLRAPDAKLPGGKPPP